MLNLFALRSTDPRGVDQHPEPVGADNDKTLLQYTAGALEVICAWGAHPGERVKERAQWVGLNVKNLYCLGYTKAGAPRHPLYLPRKGIQRLPWPAAKPA